MFRRRTREKGKTLDIILNKIDDFRNKRTRTKTGRLIRKAIGSTLETTIKTVYHGALAANVVSDAVSYTKSAGKLVKHAVSPKKWGNYFSNLKKGKFLGEGDLANVLFKTGLVMTGTYIPLLGVRAGIGGTSYLAKKALTSKFLAPKVARSLHMPITSSLVEKLYGLKRGTIRDKLNEENIYSGLEKLRDDKYFRKTAFPHMMDAAIGLRGYGSLIGTKWIAAIAERLAKGVEDNTKWRFNRKIAGGIRKGAEVVKNVASDYLSLKIFSGGVRRMKYVGAPDVDLVDYIKEPDRIKTDLKAYYKSGNLTNDLKETGWDTLLGLTSALDFVKNVVSAPFKGAYKLGKHIATGGVKEDIEYLKEYTDQEEYKGDAMEAIKATPGKLWDAAKTAYYDIADTLWINPQEKYALLIAGHDKQSNNDFVTAVHAKAYKQLLELGFEDENIVVMSPNGMSSLNTTGYPHGDQEIRQAYRSATYAGESTIGSEANLKDALAEIAEKVDGNDVFVMHTIAHGHNDGQNSYFGLRNDQDTVTDKELAKYAKGIDGGREIYLIESCHSGGFAKHLGQQGDIGIGTSAPDQVSVGFNNGTAMSTYFLDALKERGGLGTYTTYHDIRDALITAGKPFREDHGGSIYYQHEVDSQNPQIGNNGDVNGTRAKEITPKTEDFTNKIDDLFEDIMPRESIWGKIKNYVKDKFC